MRAVLLATSKRAPPQPARQPRKPVETVAEEQVDSRVLSLGDRLALLRWPRPQRILPGASMPSD